MNTIDYDEISLNEEQSQQILEEVQELLTVNPPLVILSNLTEIYNTYIFHEHYSLGDDFEDIAGAMVYLTRFLKRVDEIYSNVQGDLIPDCDAAGGESEVDEQSSLNDAHDENEE